MSHGGPGQDPWTGSKGGPEGEILFSGVPLLPLPQEAYSGCWTGGCGGCQPQIQEEQYRFWAGRGPVLYSCTEGSWEFIKSTCVLWTWYCRSRSAGCGGRESRSGLASCLLHSKRAPSNSKLCPEAAVQCENRDVLLRKMHHSNVQVMCTDCCCPSGRRRPPASSPRSLLRRPRGAVSCWRSFTIRACIVDGSLLFYGSFSCFFSR